MENYHLIDESVNQSTLSSIYESIVVKQSGALNPYALASSASSSTRRGRRAIVSQTESLSEKVVYFASTSFGHAPRRIKTGELSPVPKKMNPKGVEVPVFWWLSSWSSVFNNQRQEEWRSS